MIIKWCTELISGENHNGCLYSCKTFEMIPSLPLHTNVYSRRCHQMSKNYIFKNLFGDESYIHLMVRGFWKGDSGIKIWHYGNSLTDMKQLFILNLNLCHYLLSIIIYCVCIGHAHIYMSCLCLLFDFLHHFTNK